MVFLGYGKYVRADRIYALERLPESERGHGRRTRVWVEGIAEPILASRTERTIMLDMGVRSDTAAPLIANALELAERIVEQTEQGRVDLVDLARRARRLLESSVRAEPERLF
jgi:hypothetical protein